jgi:gamma-tubulin complex component 4
MVFKCKENRSISQQHIRPPTCRLSTSDPPRCRSVMDRLVWLGYLYRELDAFVSHAQDLDADASRQFHGGGGGSHYQRALATGLAEVLAVYRSAILHLEQDALGESVPVLSTITQAMHQVRVSDRLPT